MSIVKGKPKEDKGYESITKKYELLTFESGENTKWKIKYINPDDEDKELRINTSDAAIIQLKSNTLKIKEKEYGYIRFTIKAPVTAAIYQPNITIINKRTKEIEEILQFPIEVS